MTNTDILRRLRYTFNFNDAQMIELFAHGNLEATRGTISEWLKKEEETTHPPINDEQLAHFLNGFINKNRGKKEGVELLAEKRLNNNIIFRKLKIALNLQDEDILKLLELVDFKISKHELSAFFRNANHEKYRVCKDQILRNFLHGLQIKYRDSKDNG
ncbi:MAG: DUF1456 family protein [Bacteroidota bacterium]